MSKETDSCCATPVIQTIRGQKVMLDTDLAYIYGVEVKRLNEQIKRNMTRFPPDFLFRLTREEFAAVRLQQTEEPCDKKNRLQIATGSGRLRSQNATLKRGQHRKHLPYAFTEHGAIMAATVLNSPKAVEMSQRSCITQFR